MANPAADNWMAKLGIDIPQLRAKSITPVPDDNGQSLELDDGQSLAPPDAATLALKQKIRTARSEAKGAVAQYDAEKDAEARQGIVSSISKANEYAADYVGRQLGLGGDGFTDPGDKVWDGTSAAEDAADSAQAAIDAGDADTAAAYADQASDAADSASQLATSYQNRMAQGAYGVDMSLTGIKVGAEATDAVLATAVTGGAAAPAVAGGSATMANAIALTQGIGESLGAQETKLVDGDIVDWGSLSVDVLIQALTAKFGGELTGQVGDTIARQLASKYAPKVLSKYLPAIVARVVVTDASAELKTAAQAVIGELTGKTIRLADVETALLNNLTDPKSVFVAVVAGAADAKLGTLPDATGDAVLLDATGGGADAAGADLPDATGDAVPIEGTADNARADLPDATADVVALGGDGDKAGADDADLPDATTDAVPLDSSGSSMLPPTILPSSATDAVNAALSQMTDQDIQQSVDNWKTGESSVQSDATTASDDDRSDGDSDAEEGADTDKSD